MLSEFVARTFYYLFLAIVALNLIQRRAGTEIKRKATFIWATAVLVLSVIGILISNSRELAGNDLPEFYMTAAFILVATTVILVRRHSWPFLWSCPRCGRRLGWKAWLTRDTSLCDRCAAEDDAAS